MKRGESALATIYACPNLKLIAVPACDTFRREAGKAPAEYAEPDELPEGSDVIFLYCPLFPGTQGMINA